jgi:magnesium-protoporphyrin O-methyltransferase
MSCSQCQGIEEQFDKKAAEGDLTSYRKKGLSKTTHGLVESVGKEGVEGMSVLDIGGGVGMIQHELLKDGAAEATHVDASRAYIEAAKEEAQLRGLEEQIIFRHGDFVELAPEIEPADIVTLDKVICCFDDMRALVKSSAEKANRFYGVVFPRDTWLTKLVFNIMNFFAGLRSNPFRAFIHSSEEVERIVSGSGLRRDTYKRGLFWQMIVYTR